MTLDDFLEQLAEFQKQPHIWVINLERQSQFINTYKVIEDMIKDNAAASISCSINEFNDGSANISIDTDWITVRNVHSLCSAIEAASNLEIYPKQNETLHISIAFNQVLMCLC